MIQHGDVISDFEAAFSATPLQVPLTSFGFLWLILLRAQNSPPSSRCSIVSRSTILSSVAAQLEMQLTAIWSLSTRI